MVTDTSVSDDQSTASDSDVKLIVGYPGPALLLDSDGKPMLANAKGAGFEKALAGGAISDVDALIEKSRESGSIANATVTIATSRGELVLEVTAVPTLGANGEV